MKKLFHSYRQFDPEALGRFVYMVPPSGEALAPAEAAPAQLTAAPAIAPQAPDVNAEKEKVDAARETLKGKLGSLEPHETALLKKLQEASDAKFLDLAKNLESAQKMTGEIKDVALKKVQDDLNTSVAELTARIRAWDKDVEGNPLNVKQEVLARTILVRQLGIESDLSKDDPKNLALDAIIATLTPDQLKGLSADNPDHRIDLRPDQAKQVMEKFFEGKLPKGTMEASDAEITALKEYVKNKEGFKDLPETTLRYIALVTSVEAIDGGGLKINGEQITAPGDLGKYILDPAVKEKFDALSKTPPPPADRAAALTALSGISETSFKTTEQLGKIRDFLAQVQGEGQEGQKSRFGDIGALVAAITQLIAAVKAGDWKTLQEVAEDFQAGKNPIEMQKEAGDTYAKILQYKNPPPALDMMLAAYLNPRGAEANGIFGDRNTQFNLDAQGVDATTPRFSDRYRSAAKEAIKKHLEEKLGVTLDADSVYKTSEGLRMTYYHGDTKYALVVGKGKDSVIRVRRIEFDEKGKAEKPGEAYDLQNLEEVGKFIVSTDPATEFSQQKVLAQPAAPAVEPPPPPPPAPPAAPPPAPPPKPAPKKRK